MTDNRYSTFKYGTTNKYGASSGLSSLLFWGVEVDWDGDGVFDGSNEAQYMRGIRGARGRQRFVSPDGVGFDKLTTGRYYVTLDNSTGRFDAWNTASDLYPNVTYGKDCKITVKDVSTGTKYSVFYGVVENIEPQSGSAQERRVVLTIVDGWQYLRNYTARQSIVQDVSPDDAIGYVLDSINWPARWGRDLEASADSISYFWADGNKQAASVIDEIAQSFLGYFFINASGQACFRTRSSANNTAIALTSDTLLKDVSLPQPWENSRNVTRVKVHPRISAATGTIWQLVGNTPLVQNGEELTIWANYTYNGDPVPATSVISPVATTDYTANTQTDGGGTNKTSDVTVTLTDFGDTAKLVIANNSGGSVYITSLKIRGDALYEPNVADVIYQSATYSTMPREFKLDLPWQQDVNVAVDFSNVVGEFLSELHPYPVVQIEARPSLQFAPDLFDTLSLTIDTLGIGGDSYRVAYVEHESTSETCQSVRTKYYLESYIPPTDYWIWDTAEFDSTTVFGA